jgi:hypothetical protein
MDWLSFSENTGLYLYSALLQANAAILALIGVYIIFKIQSLKSEIEIVKNYIVHNTNGATAPKKYYFKFDLGNLNDKKKLWDEIKRQNLDKKDPYSKFGQWYHIESNIEFISGSVKFPSIVLAISILLNAILIIFAYSIHNQHPLREFYVFGISIIFQAYILYLVVKVIFNSMSLRRKESSEA